MKQIFLSLGSNLDEPAKKVKEALRRVSCLKEIVEFRASQLYITSPYNVPHQNDFINAACAFKTDLPPKKLFSALQEIERDLGKEPKLKDEPRPIDIDVLLYGNLYINEDNWSVPHYDMLNRLFVLKPLAELTNIIFHPKPNGTLTRIDLRKLLCENQNFINDTAFCLMRQKTV